MLSTTLKTLRITIRSTVSLCHTASAPSFHALPDIATSSKDSSIAELFLASTGQVPRSPASYGPRTGMCLHTCGFSESVTNLFSSHRGIGGSGHQRPAMGDAASAPTTCANTTPSNRVCSYACEFKILKKARSLCLPSRKSFRVETTAISLDRDSLGTATFETEAEVLWVSRHFDYTGPSLSERHILGGFPWV